MRSWKFDALGCSVDPTDVDMDTFSGTADIFLPDSEARKVCQNPSPLVTANKATLLQICSSTGGKLHTVLLVLIS